LSTPERIEWALETAHEHLMKIGRERASLSIGAFVNLGLDHVYILGGTPVSHPHGERQAGTVKQASLFAEKVMPEFR
jgi:hypothetical protein